MTAERITPCVICRGVANLVDDEVIHYWKCQRCGWKFGWHRPKGDTHKEAT